MTTYVDVLALLATLVHWRVTKAKKGEKEKKLSTHLLLLLLLPIREWQIPLVGLSRKEERGTFRVREREEVN